MNQLLWSPAVLGALLVPLIFLGGGLWRPQRAAAVALAAFWAALTTAVAFAVLAIDGGGGGGPPWLRVDVVTVVMLLLVSGLGAVIVRYATTAVRGEPRADALARWLLLTLGAVTTLVIAGHLAIVAAAWTATSLALHQLLTHERERPLALLAAHKKFLVSRLADLALWSALVLIHGRVGSLALDRLDAWAAATSTPDVTMQIAAILIAVAVVLRSAQLPFHGWLTQVMEAPTPVSALLHAGVVNIGGLVLIRLAPLMAPMAAAQLLLVGVGLVSVVVASLVTLTRGSVTVALAWSTCAQMGFMLVQCGLGAWPLALLHLVAHSLYKAHAFLSAGSTVERWRGRALHTPPPSSWRAVVMSAVVLGFAAFVGVGAMHARGLIVAGPSTWGLTLLVALSLAPLVAGPGSMAWPTMLRRLVDASLVVGLVVLTHRVADALVPVPAMSPWVVTLGWAAVGVASVLLFGLKTALTLAPGSVVAERLWPWLFAGLHLDERVTRLTFMLWPPQLPPPPRPPSLLSWPASAGVSR
jgi:NAD(P)H-quinone oxidoreductase subunit 5